jgi:TatD DNase family protein
MFFDTHCHLNFKAFKNNLDEVVENARKSAVDRLLVPGTDLESSRRAIEIAEAYENIYAAVGIHPHHVQELRIKNLELRINEQISEIEELLKDPKVVAVGEVGLDKHQYTNTKYPTYSIDRNFVELQEKVLGLQIKLALSYQKTLIIHNWEARKELLNLLEQNWDDRLSGRVVFHCCEAERKLLDYAIRRKIYVGVDGDVTFNQDKADFIEQVPPELLVLETDSPYLLPEPIRASRSLKDQKGKTKWIANEPKNISLIAEEIAKILNKSIKEVEEVTYNNSVKLFNL